MARSGGALRVIKYRGVKFRGGYHDFTITTGGVNVFPRLVAAEHRSNFDAQQGCRAASPNSTRCWAAASRSGSSTLILGPAGTGKSLARHHLRRRRHRAGREGRAVRVRRRARPAVRAHEGPRHRSGGDARAGNLVIEQVDAAELSPGEFAHRVRERVDEQQIKTVVIDSLNGYQAAMPEENSLILHMHELLQYLNRQGAATFMTVAQHGLVGDMKAPVDVTYLADTVILLRYFEALGKVRRAISVIKKRTGAHETPSANTASTSAASPSARRSRTSRACFAACRSIVGDGPAAAAGEGRVKPGSVIRARRHPGADGTRRGGGRGADHGGGLPRRCLRRHRRPDE